MKKTNKQKICRLFSQAQVWTQSTIINIWYYIETYSLGLEMNQRMMFVCKKKIFFSFNQPYGTFRTIVNRKSNTEKIFSRKNSRRRQWRSPFILNIFCSNSIFLFLSFFLSLSFHFFPIHWDFDSFFFLSLSSFIFIHSFNSNE